MNDKIKVKNIVPRCGADSLLPLMMMYMLYIRPMIHVAGATIPPSLKSLLSVTISNIMRL